MSEAQTSRDITQKQVDKSQQLKWVRFAILLSFVINITFFHYGLGIHYQLSPFFALFAVALAYNTFFLILEKFLRQNNPALPTILLSIRTILDSLMLSLLAYFTGGAQSFFVFFFLLTVIGFTILTNSLPLSLIMGFTGGTIYVAIFVLAGTKMIPPPPAIVAPAQINLILAEIIMLSWLFFFIAFLIAYLLRSMEQEERAASQAKQDLDNLQPQISKKIEEMAKINKFMVNRETQLKILKDQANQLLTELGQPAKYT